MAISEQTTDPSNAKPIVHTRGYQQELLEESLKKNIIIALDTGSGKTHIAMLRMKHETEKNSHKISWFIAPTVALIAQQRNVIASAIPVPVGLVSGASEPDQWKNADLWKGLLSQYKIMVTTPQILLDALHHGYIDLGRDIGLLVFDEAHHATSKHPYNEIMRAFYHPLPPREGRDPESRVRPMVLGLTASPIYGGNVDRAFSTLEINLDAQIRSSRLNREELATFVHRPVFKHVVYHAHGYSFEELPSRNAVALQAAIAKMDIEDDPYVVSLRRQLAKLPAGEQRNRVDQKLSKALIKKDTFSHKGLRDFSRAAFEICCELGPWAADWFVAKVLEQARKAANPYNNIMSAWQEQEKLYLMKVIDSVHATIPSDDPKDIMMGLSPKVKCLLEVLRAEEKSFRTQDEPYSGLIFVTRRDAVIVLAEIISKLPEMVQDFRVGCLLGTSSSFKRHSFLDITRTMIKDSAEKTLDEFRAGEKNIVVCTSVAEEGLDIQACGSVIRFDPPTNMVGWAQSRGRARRQRSSFVIMFSDDPTATNKVLEWEQMEREMVSRYNDVGRDEEASANWGEIDENIEYRVDSTGALLTLDSALSHLNHFCAVLPSSGHQSHVAIFDLDPPDYEEGWHSQDPKTTPAPYPGPWGASVTLPRQLIPELRKFSTSRVYPSKRSARNHVAFFAYMALYNGKLLNEHLLPLSSVTNPDDDGQVKLLIDEVEKRAGLANVTIQMDPWTPLPEDKTKWWATEIAIEGLPAIHIFTQRPLPDFLPDEQPRLFPPGKRNTGISVAVRSSSVPITEDVLSSSREFTRRVLSPLYGKRMDAEKSDYSYLFFPVAENGDDKVWEERRRWMQARLVRVERQRMENEHRVNADDLGKQFGYPLDLALVRANNKFDKALQFIGWHDGPISEEEKEELMERYDGVPDMDISYPLLIAQPISRLANFLIPTDSDEESLGTDYPFLIHPRYATVELVSVSETQYARMIPSLIRFLSIATTVHAMRNTLFASSPLASIPFSLLRVALTAPVSQEQENYQRLETLGDCVLKYVVSIQLFAQYPLWHEGYLARRKDHAINNNRLAKEAIRLELYRWIIRDRFVPRKWRPRYDTDVPPKPLPEGEQPPPQEVDVDAVEDNAGAAQAQQQQKPKKKKKKAQEQLSTKMLADVVEALVGAAYEHGGFSLAVDCTQLFDLGIPSWEKIPQRIKTALSRVESAPDLPNQLNMVETMLGYQFKHRILLVEALTHGSYTGDLETVSYERLEFLGDAALDMIVTDFLYHYPGKNFTPGYMHIYKEALVNSHFLAFWCLHVSYENNGSVPMWSPQAGITFMEDRQKIHLHQCLLHSSTRVMDDQEMAFSRYKIHGESILSSLQRDSIYPWAALTSLQAPKFLSDQIESLLGAIFLDSDGNLDVVRGVLKTIGITAIMDRIVLKEIDVLHPVSRLAIWAAKEQRKMKIVTEKVDGDVSCAVLIDEVEEFRATEKYRGKTAQNEVRFQAAEGAIRKLQVREEEVVEDIDDMDWGDVPEYDW